MSVYNFATCALTPSMKSAIQGATKITLSATIRPSWSKDVESLFFGVTTADPSSTLNSGVLGPSMYCQPTRNEGGGVARNNLGFGVLASATSPEGGSRAAPPESVDRWIDVATVLSINHGVVPPGVIPITYAAAGFYWRTKGDSSWLSVGARESGALSSSTFVVNANAQVLMIGNRRTFTTNAWIGGIAQCSFAIGAGGGDTPGGTPIASWRATPPHTTYTDPQGNTWTINGSSWRWGTTC